MHFLNTAFTTFIAMFFVAPLFFMLVRVFGIYTIVEERTCRVYVLFGKVLGVLNEPGLHILPFKLGPAAFLVNFLGKCEVLDLRLDQEYLRSQPVNSEEGAPMGVGIWYEMAVSDPVAYLFNNMDPRGSLRANVSNATVRCLSNMPLESMLETRHYMSQTVRTEVSPKSSVWGYQLGSVYVRKVHFRDTNMIRQIEEKVVNRLRQVTSAIRQDGANQVNIITSSAEREAAVEFAKAAIIRPEIIGQALQEISQNPQVSQVLFDILETQKMLNSKAQLTLLPGNRSQGLLADLLATQNTSGSSSEALPQTHKQGASQPHSNTLENQNASVTMRVKTEAKNLSNPSGYQSGYHLPERPIISTTQTLQNQIAEKMPPTLTSIFQQALNSLNQK